MFQNYWQEFKSMSSVPSPLEFLQRKERSAWGEVN